MRLLKAAIAHYIEDAYTYKSENTVEHFDIPATNLLLDHFGDVPLSTFNRHKLTEFKLALLGRYKPNTARIWLRGVRTFLRYYGVTKPFLGFKFPTEEEVGRVLAPDEIEIILSNSPPDIRKAFIFALYTGVRIGELINACWEKLVIDENGDWFLDIWQKKTGRWKTICLPPPAIEAMGERREKGFVFVGITTNRLHWHLRTIRARFKLSRIRFHDLRHTWATRFMESTGDQYALQNTGGWKDIRSTSRYQHKTKSRLRANLRVDLGINPSDFSSHNCRLRGVWGNPWGFKSPPAHGSHKRLSNQAENEERQPQGLKNLCCCLSSFWPLKK